MIKKLASTLPKKRKLASNSFMARKESHRASKNVKKEKQFKINPHHG
jgi:hypothetical protein